MAFRALNIKGRTDLTVDHNWSIYSNDYKNKGGNVLALSLWKTLSFHSNFILTEVIKLSYPKSHCEKICNISRTKLPWPDSHKSLIYSYQISRYCNLTKQFKLMCGIPFNSSLPAPRNFLFWGPCPWKFSLKPEC